jgi:F-type H+-transporting ATPase subunit beta
MPDQVARVTSVRGPVIRLCQRQATLPAINDAVIVDPDGSAVVCEVQAHLDTQSFPRHRAAADAGPVAADECAD